MYCPEGYKVQLFNSATQRTWFQRIIFPQLVASPIRDRCFDHNIEVEVDVAVSRDSECISTPVGDVMYVMLIVHGGAPLVSTCFLVLFADMCCVI